MNKQFALGKDILLKNGLNWDKIFETDISLIVVLKTKRKMILNKAFFYIMAYKKKTLIPKPLFERLCFILKIWLVFPNNAKDIRLDKQQQIQLGAVWG